MTQVKVELTDEQQSYVAALVNDGVYPDTHAVLRAALARMQASHEEKLIELREAIQEGIDSGVYEGDPFADARAELGWTS